MGTKSTLAGDSDLPDDNLRDEWLVSVDGDGTTHKNTHLNWRSRST